MQRYAELQRYSFGIRCRAKRGCMLQIYIPIASSIPQAEGDELLFQFEESMRISGIMHSQSPIFGRGWRTRMEAQK